MNPLEILFANAIECTSKGIHHLYATQDSLIIDSLNSHLNSLELSYKKEKSISVLTDLTHIILTQKNPHTSLKLTSKQEIILQQMDKVSFCISKVPKLNPSQKGDILELLYNKDMKQCIDTIIQYSKKS
ncbi:hypothetical protein [Nitrosopumilus sp. Nsub]|uniref:hypothetical protein n=1 Tax=Nitrosopumilus sp. Nsub TaxID=1776294 RepID=UPI00082AF1DC|nr:hypothetical protein [Nitrosopumilus sp. Nsub]